MRIVLKIIWVILLSAFCLNAGSDYLFADSGEIETQLASDNLSKVPQSTSGDLESEWAEKFKKGKLSFAMLLLVVFLGGLFTNLTPCVYPMIPITLRLLGRDGDSHIVSGGLYGAGILVTYTSLGVSAALSGGLFGSFMASKAFNIVFAALMALLAVSMLGVGNFSKLQMIGTRLGAGAPSHRNTFLMGIGAGLVASPCTGPILAALLAFTAGSQEPRTGAFLLFVYSFGFALPYVFLGGFAAKVTRIKVPANIQIGIKVGFSSVMFALAFYYLRIPAYGIILKFSELWFQIGATALGFGAAISAVAILIPRIRDKKMMQLAPAVLFGFGIFGFVQASGGSTTTVNGSIQPGVISLNWHKNEKEAFTLAKKTGRPILVDGWAEWCAACKKMDAHTFVDPALKKLLAKEWVLLKLDLTESNDTNEQLIERFGFGSLPTLILIPPDGDLERKAKIRGFVEAVTVINRLKKFSELIAVDGGANSDGI